MKLFYSENPAFHIKHSQKFRYHNLRDVHCLVMNNIRALWYHPSGTFYRSLKILNSCYICANQNDIMILGFFKTMSMWQTSSIVVCNTSWEARTTISKSFNFPKSYFTYNHSITFLHDFVIVRELQHNWRMLEFWGLKKNVGGLIAPSR